MTDHQHIEVQLVELKTDIKHIKKSIDENKEEHKEIKHLIQEFVNKVDDELDKKASKTTVATLQKGLAWVAGVIVTSLIGILGFLVKYTLFS